MTTPRRPIGVSRTDAGNLILEIKGRKPIQLSRVEAAELVELLRDALEWPNSARI
jgi:hypothetical protein